MPRPRPPHLHRQVTQHGKVVWYVRIAKGPRTRLKAVYGSEDFWAEYRAAIDGTPLRARSGPAKGTLTWLWDQYRDSGAWATLSVATRRQRENIMVHVLAASGMAPYLHVNEASIVAAIEKRSKTPAAARNFLDTMKGLFRWAKKAKHVRIDPTASADVTAPKRKKGPGFPAWTRGDVETYRRRWPLGTRQRVWLDVLLYTGPRRGDACVIGKQHETSIRNEDGSTFEGVQFKTEKSGELVTVSLPILPALRTTLDAGPTGDLAWICGARGEPYTKESFGNAFSEAARQAGIKKSAHGVRKIAATIAAENGATAHQLMAIFGWATIRQAEVYTREAERSRMSGQAAHKLDETGTTPPSLSMPVRAGVKNSQ